MKWLQGGWLHGGQDGVAGAWAQQQEALGHRGEGVASEDVQAKSGELGPGQVKGEHGGPGGLADGVEALEVQGLGQGQAGFRVVDSLLPPLQSIYCTFLVFCLAVMITSLALPAETLVPENTMFFLFWLTALESGFD